MKGCELCGGDRFRLLATEIREGPGRILQCEACGLVFQSISQSGSELKRYYNEEYQRTNSLRAGEAQSPREHF